MEHYNGATEITSRDYVRVFFRHWGIILMTMVTVMATVAITVLLRTPIYQGQVKMLISGQKQSQSEYYTDIGFAGSRSSQVTLTQSEIVASDPVLERAVAALKLAQKPFDYEKNFAAEIKKPLIAIQAKVTEKRLEKLPKDQKEAFMFRLAVEDLRNRLDVDPVRDTDLFHIKVTDFNPVGAAVTANVISRSYVIFDLEQQLAEMELKYGDKNLSVIQLKEAIDKMSKGLNGAPLSAIEAIGPATVKIIEQAKMPLKPAGIPRPLTLILAFFLSIFLGILAAFGFEYMDQTIKSPREVRYFLDTAYLGYLPKRARSDDYHELSEQLYLMIKEGGIRSALFTSVMPHDGVTPIVSNLGIYIAENLRKKVLLIDTNLRNPALHKLFKQPEANNLLDVIESKITLEKGVIPLSQNLHLLTSGSSNGAPSGKMKIFRSLFKGKSSPAKALFNPTAVLESQRMKDLVRKAKDSYDLVIIDSAPLSEAKDAAIVSAFSDGVVIVIKERKTRRYAAKYALEPLKARKTNVLGVVLNGRTFVIPKAIYDRV